MSQFKCKKYDLSGSEVEEVSVSMDVESRGKHAVY